MQARAEGSAHLIFIRPLSTPGLLPAARAPSQNPPGIQNPRIVLLSDSISGGTGKGYLEGPAESLVLSGCLWTLFLLFQRGLPLTPSLMPSSVKDVDGGYINQWSAIGFSEQARAITA